MRIVSLLPSATEIICGLGLEDQLVGVTHECDYPPAVLHLPKVTHTLVPHEATSGQIDQLVREQLKTTRALYTLNLPLLQELKPDLIVTQSLCDVCAVAQDEVQAALSQLPGHPRIINLEPQSLSDVFTAMRSVASEAGLSAEHAIELLTSRVETVTRRSALLTERPRMVLLEWLDPPFSCGHWSPELVRRAGGIEELGQEGMPSRTLRWDEVIACEPEVIFIACCGLNVKRTIQDLPLLQSGWGGLPAVQSDRVYVTDGSQYFSRPGPRLVDSLEILAHALHPTVHELPTGLPAPTRVTKYAVGCHEGN
jgi:iron complex transport system substrate-binding protein